MDHVSVICKLAMKWNLMRMCASRLYPFQSLSRIMIFFSRFNPQRRCYYHTHCQNGYYCDSYRCCRPNNQRPCSHHVHCPQGWYCDYSARLCKVGERRCTNHYQCYNQICVGGKCRNRECYYHQHCKNGYYCESPGICKALCTSDSACKDSQCCAKYNSGQTYGICKDLKKPEEWCLLEVLCSLY